MLPLVALILCILASARPTAAAAAWSCPATGAVPSAFVGSFPAAGGAAVAVLPDALYFTAAGDAVPSVRCIVHVFINPNDDMQAFLTYGDARNFANDTLTGCSFLDVSGEVIFSETTNSSLCPLDPVGERGGAWTPGATAPAECPARGLVPPALRGTGRLPDPDGTADSVLVVDANAWANITAGSFVAPGCVVEATSAPAGVAALSLSSRADGVPEACVWARPGADKATMQYKLGQGAACPYDFGGALTVLFTFAREEEARR